MRRHMSVGFLALALLAIAGCAVIRPQAAAPAPSDAAEPTTLAEADSGKEIVLQRGARLAIVLEANPSTGYAWASKEAWDEGVLQLVSKESKQASEALGSPESEQWLFLAKGAGEVKLSLAYERSWEKDVAPERTFTLTVKVQ